MAGYLVTTVWWPDGWEPNTPLDVPKCLGHARDRVPHELMTYEQAVAIVRGLNQQNMDHPGPVWYVAATVKDEPAAPTDQPAAEVHADERGRPMIDTRRLEVARLAEGSGPGDCSHCPARDFPCTTEP